MASAKNPFVDDNFAKYVGIELVESSAGSAKARLAIEEKHLNGTGTVHGGAIYTLAVWTMAVAANEAADGLSVGLNGDISYLRPVRSGTITAQANQSADAGRVGTWDVTITNDDGEAVAVFKGLVYKKFR